MEHLAGVALSILTATATGFVGYLVHRIQRQDAIKAQEAEALEKQRQKEYDALRKSLLALTRDRILQGYRYYKRNGGISAQDHETMEKLYAAYHALGGNGTITVVHEKIQELPLKEGD